MQCPIDQTDLVMTDRNGVEIDYCPRCRGVWLDRGELDKILDRAAEAAASRPVARVTPAESTRHEQGRPKGFLDKAREALSDRDDDDSYDRDYRGRRKKKRESFLDDLFDF